jgi:hypothetical protein
VPKASPIQNSFNAGELSPQLKGREDLQKYAYGCEILENLIPKVHGPAQKRPGTRFVREVKDSGSAVRLIPFRRSNDEAYILEFGDEYIRFYRNGGIILDGGSPYEITTPYTVSDLVDLDYAQSVDVMYITHPDRPPRKLLRMGDTDWSIETVQFAWPPFNDDNIDESLTVTASAVTGTGITLTASDDIFVASDVGRSFRMSELIRSKYDPWQSGDSVTSGELLYASTNVYESTGSGTTGIRVPVHDEGTESDGSVDWIYRHSGSGYAVITAFTSAAEVTATVVSRLPNSATSGTRRWSLGAWSQTTGYPGSVTFYEDRLWFAGNRENPQTLWASVTGDYENHKYGTTDDAALNYTINSQDSSKIEWLDPSRVLVIGTDSSEYTLSASATSEPVTPTNVRIIPQTSYGTSNNIRPLRVGLVTLFVQRSSRKLREYIYSFDSDSYVAADMTVLAEHISGDGFIAMAYQQEPDQVVWLLRDDGVLIGLTYERQENVIGWHRHPMVNGEVESIATIPHWDGDQDVLWMVVKRTIDGSVVRYVEYVEKYRTDDTALFLDCGASYDGSPTTTITGADHLEGETVSVMVDGSVHPNRTVSSGTISLQREGSKVQLGLPLTARLRTMPLSAGSADGTAQGKISRINTLSLRLQDTGPGLYYGSQLAPSLDELHMRNAADDMDSPIPLYSGDFVNLSWPDGYREGMNQIQIEHRLPTPFTLISLMPQVNVSDR